MSKIYENIQKMCDNIKWNASQDLKRDLSGEMPYCIHCEKCLNKGNCVATQEEREKYYLCAKAYKRMTANNEEKVWLSKNV